MPTFSFTPIDVPGSTYTQALGINDRGQIAGLFGDSPVQHGDFLATPAHGLLAS